MDDLTNFLKKISDHMEKGGTFCGECHIFFDSIVEGRKHDFTEHYDYALAQCGGDKKKLMEWMNLNANE